MRETILRMTMWMNARTYAFTTPVVEKRARVLPRTTSQAWREASGGSGDSMRRGLVVGARAGTVVYRGEKEGAYMG
jgi:hypothetical protein